MIVAAVLLGALLALQGRPSPPRQTPSPPVATPESDAPELEARAALELLYDGQAELARERLDALSADHPTDPLVAHLQALVVCWTLEQRPDLTSLDRELEQRVDRAVAMADARLKRRPTDVRARLARGGAHGVRSRYHLFRLQRSPAARAAVRMREDLLAVREMDPANPDALFGLGLYDYYVDVLPRAAKVLRFLARMPGGDRERGLLRIEQAKAGSSLHRTEAQVQLYEIYAYFEDQPDRAAEEMRDLRRRYPSSPLWTLKLAEHLRERMGAYAESAAVLAPLLTRRARGTRDPGAGAVVLARLALGETLVGDLRPGEARRALLPIKDTPALPTVASRARLLLGRTLELEGDRDGAVAHYRAAAQAGDRETRRGAQQALAGPMAAAQVRGLHLVAEARRHRESGRAAEAAEAYAEAFAAWPESVEAALGVAEDALRHGAEARAREVLPEPTEPAAPPLPPWTRPWSWLLWGQLHDLHGERERALLLYQKVLSSPHGRVDLRARAAEAARSAYRPAPVPSASR